MSLPTAIEITAINSTTGAIEFVTDLTVQDAALDHLANAPATACGADALAQLNAEQQALIARCTTLMNAYVAAKNAADLAYSNHTLLSAQADEAWQVHREQNHIALQLHEQWRAALRQRQNLFEQIRNGEDIL